jgi:ATP-dependent RNA helicase RhlE
VTRKLDRQGISAAAIHSNRTQGQRERALEGFRRGNYRVLVATDIAARGIDVDGISHVINFDVPQYPEDYIHRIGRTGRAGATGDALTLVSAEEREYLRRLARYTGRECPVTAYPGGPVVPPAPAPARDPFPRKVSTARPPFPHTRPKGVKRRRPVQQVPVRKRKRTGPLGSFSSDTGGAGWSNY